MNDGKILVTGAARFSECQIEALSRAFGDVVFMKDEAGELPCEASDVVATVCNGLFLSHDIDLFSRLRFIQLTSAGLDRVPLDRIRERGIALFNARGVYSVPMAEWALFRVLEHYKQAGHFALCGHKKAWEKCRDLKEINGKRIGVLGAGDIGCRVGRLFAALGADVVGFDVNVGDRPGFSAVLEPARLRQEASELDVIILTAPSLASTYHVVDAAVLRSMKADAMLVNVSRGSLVDEAALADVLTVRTDLFAALDVFETEPLEPSSPLWSMSNVAISPHNSFVSDGNNRRLFDLTLENFDSFCGNG